MTTYSDFYLHAHMEVARKAECEHPMPHDGTPELVTVAQALQKAGCPYRDFLRAAQKYSYVQYGCDPESLQNLCDQYAIRWSPQHPLPEVTAEEKRLALVPKHSE